MATWTFHPSTRHFGWNSCDLLNKNQDYFILPFALFPTWTLNASFSLLYVFLSHRPLYPT
jgi:hypothetical protein